MLQVTMSRLNLITNVGGFLSGNDHLLTFSNSNNNTQKVGTRHFKIVSRKQITPQLA
jgi:hypothetical protein